MQILEKFFFDCLDTNICMLKSLFLFRNFDFYYLKNIFKISKIHYFIKFFQKSVCLFVFKIIENFFLHLVPSSLPHLHKVNIYHHPSPISIYSTFTIIPFPLHILNIYHHPSPISIYLTFTIIPPPSPYT